jgi:transcriptional regulator with XRE-family HTH domain
VTDVETVSNDVRQLEDRETAIAQEVRLKYVYEHHTSMAAASRRAAPRVFAQKVTRRKGQGTRMENAQQERRVTATEVRQRIGPAIRRLRQQQGLSLSDLAQRTDISVSYLSRLEKGRSVPSFTLLSRLGQELGVDIGFFVETEREAQSVDEMLEQSLGRTNIPSALWPELFSLSIEARKALLNFLENQGFSGKA